MPINLRKLVSDIGYSSVRVAISLIRGIALVPIITKLLGSDIYGTWAAGYAIFGLLVGIGSLHLHGALIRYIPTDENTKQTFSELVTLSTIVAAFVSLIFAGIVGPSLFDSAETTVYDLRLSDAIAIALFPYLPLKIIENYPRSQGLVKRYEIIRITRLAAETIVLILVFLFFGSPVIAFISVGAVATIAGLVFLVIFPIYITIPPFANVRKYFEYGLPMLPKQVGEMTVNSIDKYLVVALLSSSSGGVYAATYIIPSFIKKFTTLVNPTLYPTITDAWEKNKIRSIESLYSDIFRWYTIVVIPSTTGISLLSEPLLLLFSTPAIADTGRNLIPLLAVGFAIYGYADLSVYVLTAAKETTRIAAANILGAIINVILNLLLIPIIGVEGAAIATICSFLFISLLIITGVKRHIRLEPNYMTLIKSIISSLIMALILIRLPLSHGEFRKVTLFPILGSIIYFSLLILLGELSTKDISNLISILK